MKLYCKEKDYTLYNGSMLEMLEVVKPNSVDAIVCDPPYELNFMGKGWDNSGIAFNPDAWGKCFDVLKDGGYLLAFGGSRTYHRICCAIEDAGFEIRDCIMWLYGSGFPKSMNLGLAIDKKNGVESKVIGRVKGSGSTGINERGNQQFVAKNQYEDGTYDLKEAQNEWKGWGSQLKPAYEPIIVARKPFKGSLVDNVIENGVGGLNIDECRVEYEDTPNPATNPLYRQNNKDKYKQVQGGELSQGAVSWASGKNGVSNLGRFPANVILTYDDTDFDEVCSGFPDTKSPNNGLRKSEGYNSNCYGKGIGIQAGMNNGEYGDSGSAARYFYCAKASKKDRDEGLDLFDNLKVNDGRQTPIDNPFQRGETPRKNIHPTVKPIELMQYLIRLVAPKGATIMDCFMGSGSTGKAVMFENRERDANYHFIGIELTDEYLPICQSRIDYAINKYEYDLIKEQRDAEEETGQTCLDLFGDY